MRRQRKFVATWTLVLATLVAVRPSGHAQVTPQPHRTPILQYIAQTWKDLTRTHAQLAAAAVDPKLQPLPNGRWPVYIPASLKARATNELLQREMNPADFSKIELRTLPSNHSAIEHHGLLYLPRPYVVPGGRFNEMYGWDSYFIQVGLLRDGELALAKDMADNFLFEIREYGKILNANRTYYLSRSQPPFLTQMLLGVYRKTGDRKWLKDAVPWIEKYYRFWTTEPHLTPQTGLSRYYDLQDGPAPEVVSAEKDAQGRTHYELIREFFRTHEIKSYNVDQYYDRRDNYLKPLFYKGDRTMRESGFDPSNRFGEFNIDVIHYNPVCLNTLLYLMEMQTAEILEIVGRGKEVGSWRARAKERAEKINRLMWNAEDGLYYDYNFVTNSIRRYPFLTTFYPLWAGFATRDQATRVAANLSKFEAEGGLQTSTYRSGNQWDAPFGWAPLQMIAVQGLRRYGFHEAADRIAVKFLTVVHDDYVRRGAIVEKYDVVQPLRDVSAQIQFGYSSNEVGFGWTNAVFTALLDELSSENRKKVLEPAAMVPAR